MMHSKKISKFIDKCAKSSPNQELIDEMDHLASQLILNRSTIQQRCAWENPATIVKEIVSSIEDRIWSKKLIGQMTKMEIVSHACDMNLKVKKTWSKKKIKKMIHQKEFKIKRTREIMFFDKQVKIWACISKNKPGVPMDIVMMIRNFYGVNQLFYLTYDNKIRANAYLKYNRLYAFDSIFESKMLPKREFRNVYTYLLKKIGFIDLNDEQLLWNLDEIDHLHFYKIYKKMHRKAVSIPKKRSCSIAITYKLDDDIPPTLWVERVIDPLRMLINDTEKREKGPGLMDTQVI